MLSVSIMMTSMVLPSSKPGLQFSDLQAKLRLDPQFQKVEQCWTTTAMKGGSLTQMAEECISTYNIDALQCHLKKMEGNHNLAPEVFVKNDKDCIKETYGGVQQRRKLKSHEAALVTLFGEALVGTAVAREGNFALGNRTTITNNGVPPWLTSLISDAGFLTIAGAVVSSAGWLGKLLAFTFEEVKATKAA